MATSGTIGSTTVETRKILEHALRRIGISATSQTPEIVSLALDNLFLLMLNLSSRGLNLWTIDKVILPSVSGQLKYTLPSGTIDVLNMAYARCVYTTGTNTISTTDYTVTLAQATQVVRVGMTLTVLPVLPITIQGSNDAITWVDTTTIPVNELQVGLTYHDIGTSIASGYSMWRIYAGASTFTSTGLTLITQVSELPIVQINRDSYTALPNKYNQANLPVNYYFEKLVDPVVNLWPVPNDSTGQVVVWRYRQPQDVGTLSETMEIPARWYETIIWNLAARLCFEIPQVDPAKAQLVLAQNDKYQAVTENGETDGAPMYYTSQIGVYTR